MEEIYMKEIILCLSLMVTIWIISAIIFSGIHSLVNEYEVIQKYYNGGEYYIVIKKQKLRSKKTINVTVSKNDYDLLNVGDKIIINI